MKQKWQKMRPGNPITGAIIAYVRKYLIAQGGTIEVTCAPDTDIDGLYRVVVGGEKGIRVYFIRKGTRHE